MNVRSLTSPPLFCQPGKWPKPAVWKAATDGDGTPSLPGYRESEITLQETENDNPVRGKGELQLQRAF